MRDDEAFLFIHYCYRSIISIVTLTVVIDSSPNEVFDMFQGGIINYRIFLIEH